MTRTLPTDLEFLYREIAERESELAALHAKARELEERSGKEWERDEAYDRQKRIREERY